MRSLDVGEVTVTFDGGRSTVGATVLLDGSPRLLEFVVPGDRRADARPVDAFVTVSMVAAMRSCDRLRTEEPVSARLLASLEQIQAIYTTWYPDELSTVVIEAKPRTADDARAPGTATCFTGGVDSFHTLLRHHREVTHLMYVEGYDVPRYNTAVLAEKRERLDAVAAATGTRAIVANSNVKQFCLESGRWGEMTSGPALAAAAQLLAPSEFGQLLIPSGETYARLRPWGYHPLTDPLWSTEYLSIRHVDADTDRLAKTVSLLDSPLARSHLHVCLRANADYNCGTCYKCLRTMVTLEAAGVLRAFRTFPDVLDLDLVRRTPPRGDEELSYAVANRDLAEQNGRADVVDALTVAIATYRRGLVERPSTLAHSGAAWSAATGALVERLVAAARWRARRLGRRLRRRAG